MLLVPTNGYDMEIQWKTRRVLIYRLKLRPGEHSLERVARRPKTAFLYTYDNKYSPSSARRLVRHMREALTP